MNEKPTILIVDDDRAGREAIRGVLLSQDYQLLEAVHGQNALDLAQENIPDLILLDVMMPGMDGFEVCRRLRADAILREIPVLMLTALDDRQSRLQGIEAGADDFISKPFDRTELRARVRTITRLNRYRHLLLERARFVWVVENDQDGYLILDEQGRLNFANAAARDLLSLAAEEAETGQVDFLACVKSRFLCIPPEQWEAWPETRSLEDPLYLIRPQDEKNRPLWFEVYALDLPWLSKKQRLLRIKDVTQSCSLSFETWSFQAAARHKLVTPVSNMVLSIEVMKMLAKQASFSRDMMDCIETIEEGTRRLEQEMKDVLQYIHAPGMVAGGDRFQAAEMGALVERSAQDLGLADVTCTAGGLLESGATLPLSGRAVQIILWELFENARKFHPQMAPRIQVEILAQDAGEIALKVTDDGVWIPLEHQRHLFTPYYQGEKTYSGEVNGMGLGLSTVAAIVWQAGGRIALKNRADCPGVIVEMKFPLGEDPHFLQK